MSPTPITPLLHPKHHLMGFQSAGPLLSGPPHTEASGLLRDIFHEYFP